MEESTLLKRLLILKCISSPQSKDVGKIEFFCMERNARVDILKSIATPERDFNLNLYLFLFDCNRTSVICSRCHRFFFLFLILVHNVIPVWKSKVSLLHDCLLSSLCFWRCYFPEILDSKNNAVLHR